MHNKSRYNCLDVNKIYTASDRELLEFAKPRNIHFINTHDWFEHVASTLSTHQYQTSPSKIKNIYYGNSKFTAIERIHLEDLARRQAQSQIDPRQLSLLEDVCVR